MLGASSVEIWLDRAAQRISRAVKAHLQNNGAAREVQERSTGPVVQVQIIDGAGQTTKEKALCLGVKSKCVNVTFPFTAN